MKSLFTNSKDIDKYLDILRWSWSLIEEKAIVGISDTMEEVFQYAWELKDENQKLKDEINKLKWEQWKPDIKPNHKQEDKEEKNNSNISSEKERNWNWTWSTGKKPRNKRWKKKDNLKIDKEIICEIDKSTLPSDAVFKWYSKRICQDIIINPNNTLLKREHYYSPSLWKSFYWITPKWYEWDFWPWIKSIIIQLKHECNMSETKILSFLTTAKIDISKFTITNILIKNNEIYYEEKNDIYLAGLKSTPYQQTDDTWEKINGINNKLHIMCNQFYSCYFSSLSKSRLTIIDLLMNFQERKYLCNEKTIDLLWKFNVSKSTIDTIVKKVDKWKIFTEEEFETLLLKLFPELWKNNKLRIKESFAITYYQQQSDFPIVKILICDDAPQFKNITELLGLCWVHDGRHYKKIIPFLKDSKIKLENFILKYWNYYKSLKKYKDNPTIEMKERLSKDFDILFSIKTGYLELDKRIEKTKNKKSELLLILDYPEIPLHNNAAELAVRVQVRKRDVSLQTRTEQWTEAKNTFLTIIETAKKLWVNIYDYIYDRVTQKYDMKSLADLITEVSKKKLVLP